jgi:hypothetical protein
MYKTHDMHLMIETDTFHYSINHIFDILNAMIISSYISTLCSKRSLFIATSYFCIWLQNAHKDSVMLKADNKVSYFTIKNHTFASLLASDRLAAMSLKAVGRALNLKENSQPKAAVRGHSDSGARSLSFSKSGCLSIQLL